MPHEPTHFFSHSPRRLGAWLRHRFSALLGQRIPKQRGACGAAFLLALLSGLHANTLHYDTASTAGFPANASFTWNTSALQWGNATGTLPPVAWVNANLDDAVLGTGTGTSSYTATVGSDITVGRLQRVNGTWSLALGSNTLTFNSTADWTLGESSGFGPISGKGAIVKAGANTLTLSGQNTFSGGTTLNAGTLRVESDTALGTGKLTLAGGTTLEAGGIGARTVGNSVAAEGSFTIGGDQDITFTKRIDLGGGNRTLNITNSGVTTFAGVVTNSWHATTTKTGAGTLVLKGANTFEGPFLINEGIVNLQHDSALGASVWGNAVADGAELQLQGGIEMSQGGLSIQGSGTTGAGALNNISGANTLTTALYLDGASTIGVTSGSLTLSGSLSGAQTLTTTGAGNLLFNAALTGSAAIHINGTGAVTFGGSSANSNSGPITINHGGTLVLAKAAGTNAHQALVTINDGTLRLAAANQIPDWIGVVVGSSQGLFDLNGYNDAIAHLTMTGGAVTTGAGTLTLSSSGGMVTTNAASTAATIRGNLSSTAWSTTFAVADGAAASDLELAANVSGSSHLVKDGAGTMTVSGSNTYTGTTTINLGPLKLGSAGSATTGPLGTTAGATIVNSGGALDLNGFTLASSEAFTLNGSGVSSTGALTNSSATAVTVNGAVTLDSAATIGGLGNVTVTGGLSGNHLLTKTGASVLALNGSGGARTGGAQVDAGTLRLGAADALGSAAQTITLNGGILDLASNISTNAYGVTVAADATIRSNKATAGSAGITHTLGALSIGNSQLTVRAGDNVAANTAFGVTFGATTLTGAADLNVRNNGTATGTLTLGNVSGAGSLTKSGAGALMLGDAGTYTGATHIQEGTVVVGALGNLGANSSLGAPTSATTGTIKIGSGTSSATLRYTGAGSTTNRVIDLAGTTGGATIDASGSGAIVFSNAFTASGAGSKTLTLTGTSTAANTIAGAIVNHSSSATTSLLKTGTGNWILAGQNTFSGAINVNAGTLTLAADNALAARTNQVNVASGATFAIAGASGKTTTIGGLAGSGLVSIAGGTVLQVDHTTGNTFAGRLDGAGRFVKQGTGTFTFSSESNTSAFDFSGTVALESGTLAFQGGTAASALTLGTLEISGGTLFLSHAFINVGTLNITGDTILDFGNVGASILNATNIYIATGAIVTVRNWTSEVDFLFANSSFRQDNGSGTAAQPNTEGSAPQNQVHFEDQPISNGSNTAWTEYNNGYADHQIRPIPEPSTYGALLLGACASLVAFLRRRR